MRRAPSPLDAPAAILRQNPHPILGCLMKAMTVGVVVASATVLYSLMMASFLVTTASAFSGLRRARQLTPSSLGNAAGARCHHLGLGAQAVRCAFCTSLFCSDRIVLNRILPTGEVSAFICVQVSVGLLPIASPQSVRVFSRERNRAHQNQSPTVGDGRPRRIGHLRAW